MLALRVVLLLALLGASLAFFLPAAAPQQRTKGGMTMLNLFNAKKSAGAGGKQKTFTITVQQKFYKDAELVVEGAGTPVNLRKELMKNKIDIYPLQGKIYNCGGGGQCGTCAVQVIKGGQNLK
jgi:ferredoxin